MTQSNLSLGNTNSKSVSPPSALMQTGNTVPEFPHNAEQHGSPDATLELAYGCVDWFIYVTDSVTIGPVMRLTSND